MKPGFNCVTIMKKIDKARIFKAEKAMQEIAKKCRLRISSAKRKLEDAFEEEEDPDKPSYGAGLH